MVRHTTAHPGFGPGWLAILAGLCLTARLETRAEAPGENADHLRPEIHSLTVNGSPIKLRPGSKLRLPSRTHSVIFGLGPAANKDSTPMRLRFKLDGYDETWRESEGSMRLWIRFLDVTGDQVGETAFRVTGQSTGWTGNPETAAFIPRREEIVVPPGAHGYWVVMSSAGPPATVGVYAITNLVVRSVPANGGRDVVSLPWAFGVAGSVSADGVPAGWMRDGLRPSMARVFQREAGGRSGFVIVDDDLRGHAEWHTIKEMAARVTPGDRLTVEWSEAYSFGLAGRVEVSYPALPAGYYRFRVNTLSVAGVPTDAETSLAFEVPLVFWRTPWFWVSACTLAVAAGLGVWRYGIWRQMHLRLQRLEQQRAVDRERLRIAQDIHDDLGARVTQISLLSAVAQGRPGLPEEARADFGRVSEMTRELVSALYETVWAVNPENDNLDALGNFLCQMGNRLCTQAQLRCRLEVPHLLPRIPLSSHVRHNLIMAVKEALNNAVKHAHASEVRIRITLTTVAAHGQAGRSNKQATVMTISIQDDGCGFDPAACAPGNGLMNLKRRMEDIGGSFAIESRRALGTTVTLCLPLANAPVGAGEIPRFGDGSA